MNYRFLGSLRVLFTLMLVLAFATPQFVLAQTQTTAAPTPIVLHKNKYSPMEDVRIGREAASQAERQLQIVRDPQLSEYLESVGQNLVRSIPPEFQHPEFRYYFKVVADRSINAFALPGGPMYVNTGAIMAARNEGELAGVMAHELSHVALRHGTAQATKAQKWQIGQIGAAVAGTIFAGPAAGEAAAGGIGVYFKKYSREYETEADLLGARIMARAGYDPRDLANMFKTIEAQSGSGGGFLSDHPSTKDRYAKINAEAERLQVAANPIKVTPGFQDAKQEISSNTASNRGYRGNRNPQNNYPSNGNNYPSNGNNYPASGNNYPSSPSDRVELPSARYRTYDKGTFTVNIPDNWNEVNNRNGVWYAPRGAYGSSNGQTVFTHAVTFGAVQTQYRNLQQATTEFVNSLTQASNSMRARGTYQRTDVDGRFGELISFDNVNGATGRAELINVVTTQLQNGELFYMISVTPRDEYQNYQNTFQAILRSLRLNG
jgi:Zn-dependent protease with chaperone function